MSIFPNVPIAPGVPPVPRDPLAAIITLELLAADALELFNIFFGKTQWGLFKSSTPNALGLSSGISVILADNVVAVDYKADRLISNYPVEGGAFQSYDKVKVPFEGRLEFSTGGSVSDRTAFLNSIIAIIDDTNFYDIYTPEKIYRNCNVKHWDWSRNAQKAGLVSIDVWVEEVAVTGQQSFQNVTSPSSNAPVANGSVAPQTTTTAVPKVF